MNPNTQASLHSPDKAHAETLPYPYWLLSDVLTEDTCTAVLELDIEPPQITDYGGTRAANNDTRFPFNPAPRRRPHG